MYDKFIVSLKKYLLSVSTVLPQSSGADSACLHAAPVWVGRRRTEQAPQGVLSVSQAPLGGRCRSTRTERILALKASVRKLRPER